MFSHALVQWDLRQHQIREVCEMLQQEEGTQWPHKSCGMACLCVLVASQG